LVACVLLRPAPLRQHSTGINGEYEGQQQPRQLLEQHGIPEPGGRAFVHVLMLCPSAFHLSPGDGVAHKFLLGYSRSLGPPNETTLNRSGLPGRSEVSDPFNLGMP
jgi:hypothetical protein